MIVLSTYMDKAQVHIHTSLFLLVLVWRMGYWIAVSQLLPVTGYTVLEFVAMVSRFCCLFSVSRLECTLFFICSQFWLCWGGCTSCWRKDRDGGKTGSMSQPDMVGCYIVAPPPTGITEMLLLCAGIYRVPMQQTVSCNNYYNLVVLRSTKDLCCAVYWYWDYNDANVVCRHLHYPANCK